jgi:hypothetical protein
MTAPLSDTPKATVRDFYANAAFNAGHRLAQSDPLLNFCMGDSTAMADAAVAVYRAEIVKALDSFAAVRAAVGTSEEFRRGAATAYEDAIALLTDAGASVA